MAFGAQRITITGLDDVRKKLDKFARKDLNDTLRRTVNNTSHFALEVMRDNTPVDTGNLKASEGIKFEAGGFKAFVGPDLKKAHYAPYVEYGFRHWISGKFIPGQHYVELTKFYAEPQIKKIFGDAIAKVIRESFNGR